MTVAWLVGASGLEHARVDDARVFVCGVGLPPMWLAGTEHGRRCPRCVRAAISRSEQLAFDLETLSSVDVDTGEVTLHACSADGSTCDSACRVAGRCLA